MSTWLGIPGLGNRHRNRLQRNRSAIDDILFTPRLMRGNVNPTIETQLSERPIPRRLALRLLG
ncbi:MAG: hypothetical protein R3D29_04390 [Nitratireductor sp.]